MASAISYFRDQGWLSAEVDPLAGLKREPEPKPGDRVRARAAVADLIMGLGITTTDS